MNILLMHSPEKTEKIIQEIPEERNLHTTSIMLVMCFFLVLPDDAFGWISVYNSTTPLSIDYFWLDYSFGILQLFILLIGLFYAFRTNGLSLLLIAFLLLIRELFLNVTADNSIFRDNAFEMYLALLVGFSFAMWGKGSLKTIRECERFYKLFLILNVLTIYINFVKGGGEGLVENRYHASNLDVGTTGAVCILCIIYLGYNEQKSWYDYLFIVLSIFSLILSDARANIILGGAILGLGYFFKIQQEKKMHSPGVLFKRFLLTGFILFIVLLFAYGFTNKLQKWYMGSRFAGIFSLGGLQSDSSFSGRTDSIIAGLDILKHHPFGISGYFINLQQETRLRGYPTFPHSTLLSEYLCFGPIVFVVYILWIKMLKKLQAFDMKYYLSILFLLVSTILYGSPIVNFKIYFIFFIVTILAKDRISEHQSLSPNRLSKT